MAFTEKHSVAGVLGAIIGYVGGGAADASIFERLLWPQRFYNHSSWSGLLEIATSMSMAGPIHKAALDALGVFREKGLFRGIHKGHMLGTVFYADTAMDYIVHNNAIIDTDKKVRNGIWVKVFHSLCAFPVPTGRVTPKVEVVRETPRRTLQRIHHVELAPVRPETNLRDSKVVEISEEAAGVVTVAGVLMSEIPAIVCAIVVVFVAGKSHRWFAAYLCLPLALKVAALSLSVRREAFDPKHVRAGGPSVLVEIVDYDYGFCLISGPEATIRQFFRHWGHPVRQNNFDRTRELLSIGVVFTFVVYFPVGLLSMLWANEAVQLAWIVFQVFIVLAMHLSRIFGLGDAGRTEVGLAHHLSSSGRVRLRSGKTEILQLELKASMEVFSIAESEREVKDIVDDYLRMSAKGRVDGITANIVKSPKVASAVDAINYADARPREGE